MTQSEQIKMYGITEAQIQSEYLDSLTCKLSGPAMVTAGILSDCQELLAMAGSFADGVADEAIRQKLNVAKFILFKDQK
jgi:hypothetical protein